MNDLLAPIDFDNLTVAEIPVRILGRRYILREASGEAYVKYRSAHKVEFNDSGKAVSVKGEADADMLLVSLCLCNTVNDEGEKVLLDKNGDPQTVNIRIIKSWPNKVRRTLLERIKAISSLDENETEEILVKRLEATQKKLDELRKGNTAGDALKNGQALTTDG